MDDYSIELDQETGQHCTLRLFTDVTNTSEIREKLVAGNLRCCVAKASLMTDALQAVIAANKAALGAKRNRLVTRSVYTEVLFYLSMSKNISRSLAEFGIGDNDRNILVLLIHEPDEREALLEKISESVKGERVSISRLREFTDVGLVRKTYKIEEDELRCSNLTDAVVSRISCKEFM
ncbi:PREDICTED: EKC/KEOPS complex subunit TPRKB-like [Vollenhovia emeryi]|uniref:EKC/KEOPS complex subunit TPRKB-like n=1 Tax=Vollenhovia emeryi TaxID=411798 RepID=UPI0005F517FF|nr:PREDICTED: EKC/KEOPS complex subunit TPRKB-like [Vollenhovia emeryi]